MRRGRDIRDHRDALRRKALADRKRRSRATVSARIKTVKDKAARRIVDRNAQVKSKKVVQKPVGIHLERFENYQCNVSDPIVVCHIIESLGMGGGQTMMMELVKGLDKHFEGKITNLVVCPRPSHAKNYEKGLYKSYGITPVCMREKELARYLSKHNVNIVVQHRLAVSKCLKPNLISCVKYILLNHTFHQLKSIPNFTKCDYYVSVCNYLNKQTRWPSQSRLAVILNGVENDYLDEIEPLDLEGDFKTGRCHRLVQSKFKADSLTWMNTRVAKLIPGHRHYLLGHHGEAKKICKKSSVCNYVGAVVDRVEKMRYLKSLDVYFYETFAQEGASVAILESLACGVPVLCRDYGGNKELVTEGVNGYIVNTREDFLKRMKDLADNPEKLAALKQSTLEDFNTRLHVRQTAAKYMQIFEAVLKT